MSKVKEKLIKFGHYGLFRQRGFTLIELLVVIAIIGILALIILMALMNARKKGQDARIKSNYSQIKNQAEIVSDKNGGKYGVDNTLMNDSVINSLLVDSRNINSGNIATHQVNNTPTTYVGYGRLNTGTNNYICIDSRGYSNVKTTAPAGASTTGCGETDTVW